MLEIVNLRYLRFGPLSLTVNAGECVVLSGSSGTGKSLFLRAVSDLDADHKSDILRLFELDWAQTAPFLWRRSVGYLPSQSQWWAESVRDHFLNPDPVGFSALGLPDTAMNWLVNRLSAGEKQRLAFLRLLDRSPRALLLDEPTANLDPKTTELFEAEVLRLRKEKGFPVLWITHSAEQAKRVADRHWIMNQGRIHEANNANV